LTRSKSKSQADGTGGDDTSGSVPVDHVPTAPNNNTFFTDSADNIVSSSDSISCRDGLSNGDEERNEDGEGSDSNSVFSDTSWVNEVQTWRTNVLVAVEKEQGNEGNHETGKCMGVVKGTSLGSGSSVGSYSESNTMVDDTMLMLSKPCRNDGGSGEWEGDDGADVDASSRLWQDEVAPSGSLYTRDASIEI